MMQTKIIPLTLLVAMAAIMMTSGFAASSLAATQTIDNAKKIVIKAGADTFVINVNSVPGAAGKNGVNGTNGKDGAPGKNGTNGVDGKNGVNGTQGIQGIAGPQGPQGAQGIQGIAGKNGTTTVCVETSGNQTCPTPTPVPVPTPVNGTGNTTSLHHAAHHK